MDEGSLGIHEIEFVINSGEDLSNGGGVGDHADGSHDLGEITTWDDGWWLIVDTTLETGWAPVDELDGSLGLDGGNGGVDILWYNITSVHEAACHVLSVSWVTLGHHGGGLEGGVGDLSNRQLLVVGLFGTDHGSVTGKHEVNTRVGHQVGLELSDIDVEGTIETEGGRQGGDNLSDQSVQVSVGGSFDVQRSTADIVDGFVVEHDAHISVFQQGVSGQHGVVWLNDSGGNLRRGVDGETQLGLLSVVDGKSFQEEGTETGTGTSTDGVEDEETLETSAVVSQLSDAVQAEVDNFLTDGVVTTGKVVGGIFLSGDQLFGVEQLSVGTGADLINYGGFQVKEHATGDVLAGTRLAEEGVESIITSTDGLVGGHLAVRLNTVLEAVELPAGVTDLDTGLSDVN